jgi:hypothetical protein
MVGTRYKSKNYGLMEIIAKEGMNRYRVRFLNTGTEVVTELRNIQAGLVKDRFYPTVAGKGYLGAANSTYNPKIYARWKRMMLACYDPFHLDYPSNREKGVVVTEDWHNYENYERDILQKLEEKGNPERYRVVRTGPSFSSLGVSIVVMNQRKIV